MQPAARLEEQDVFQLFCKLGFAKLDDFVYEDAPDFVRCDASVGVELVSFHSDASSAGGAGSPRRRWEAQLERLLDRAKQIYSTRNSTVLNVYAFPCRKPLTKLPPDAAQTLAMHIAVAQS